MCSPFNTEDGRKHPTFSAYYALLFFFIDNAVTVVPIFSPLLPSTQQPPLPPVIPLPLFTSMGPACKFFGNSISYAYSRHPPAYSVPTNVYFLVPSPFPPFPQMPLPTAHHPNVLPICDSVSVLFVHLVCFLDSVVDSYALIAIFIVSNFFFLNKFLYFKKGRNSIEMQTKICAVTDQTCQKCFVVSC